MILPQCCGTKQAMKHASALLLIVSPPALAQEPASDPEAIIVVASKDPIISFIRADSLEHKGKVVSQTCTVDSFDGKAARQQTRRYATSGAQAFTWQMDAMTVDGKAAPDKDRKKALKELDKRNAKRTADDDDRYGMFADLVALDDRIEKLPPENGMLRYRINRLPDKLAKDLPSAIAKRLKPILWIADAEGDPYVRKLDINLGDFRMYLVAKINAFDFNIEFERRPDGYVKERRGEFEADYSFFGSRKQSTGRFSCDEGGPTVPRAVATP
jgi:hypothetical protein